MPPGNGRIHATVFRPKEAELEIIGELGPRKVCPATPYFSLYAISIFTLGSAAASTQAPG